MVEKAKPVAIRRLCHVVRLGQTPQTREQNSSYSSQIPACASIEQIWQGPQTTILIAVDGGLLQIRLHATAVDDAVTKTLTTAHDAVTSIEAPAEIAPGDGHRAAHPVGEVTEGIAIIAVENAGVQMMVIAGRGDTHPPKSAPTDDAVAETRMTIETSLPADDEVYHGLAPLLDARAVPLQGRWNDPNVPFLPKTKRSHRRKSQGRGNRRNRQLRSRSPTLPIRDA